ncbi:MAG TPA: hypothetical protein VGS57_20120 [Thermoanaerobaculia bacterium]|jgi:hypothetical protein|nr:hypothetical protein [Thermoanaerobaculia bacterium]
MNQRRWIRAGLILTACLVATPVGLEASPWFLDSCDPSYQEKADHLRQKILQAKPGSDVFVPKPFPRTNEEVVADFEQQIRATFSPEPGHQAPPAIANLFTRLEAKTIRFEIVPVTEWRPERCGQVRGQHDRLFLIRLYDSTTAKELSRASLGETGLLGVVSTPGPNSKLAIDHDIEPLDAAQRVAQQVGLAAKDLQYVAVASPSILCEQTTPCIAFRASGVAYLYRSNRLFRLVKDRPGVAGLTTRELMQEGAARRSAITALRSSEHFVTVGAGHVAVAVPVPVPQ